MKPSELSKEDLVSVVDNILASLFGEVEAGDIRVLNPEKEFDHGTLDLVVDNLEAFDLLPSKPETVRSGEEGLETTVPEEDMRALLCVIQDALDVKGAGLDDRVILWTARMVRAWDAENTGVSHPLLDKLREFRRLHEAGAYEELRTLMNKGHVDEQKV